MCDELLLKGFCIHLTHKANRIFNFVLNGSLLPLNISIKRIQYFLTHETNHIYNFYVK